MCCTLLLFFFFPFIIVLMQPVISFGNFHLYVINPMPNDQVLVHVACTVPDSFYWTKRLQQVQFTHGFPFPYALVVFSRFYCVVAELFIILCVLCLTNAGFVQCLSLDALQVCGFAIFRDVFVWRTLRHKHRVCAMLFPQLSLVCTLCYVQ